MAQGRAVDEGTLRAIIGRHMAREGPLLPILHDILEAEGHVADSVVPVVAEALNLSRAEVHGAISFYHDFRRVPPTRPVIRLCRAEACQAVGCEATEAHAKRTLGIEYEGTTADGQFTLEPAYCLGNCAAGPSLMIDDKLFGRVTPARLDELLAARKVRQ